MRFLVDQSWNRYGSAVVAGSPLRVLRTTAAGREVVAAIERGDDVAPSRLVERLLDAGAIHPIRVEDRPPTFGAHDVTVITPQLGRSVTVDAAPTGRADTATTDVHDDGRLTIDDGSQPPLAGAAVRLAVNRGPAAARNAARPLVQTPLVAFLDADVDVGGAHPDWLEPLLWHFDDPEVGLVAPRVAGETGSPLDLGDAPARIRAGTRVSYVPGAALIVRVGALDSIGWFDEGLRFGEDVDLVWRLDQAGWRCRYDPSISVWHAPRRTWAARLRQHAGYGTSAAPLALRHPGALTPVRVNGWTLFAWASWLGGHAVTGTAVAVGSAAALQRRLPDLPRQASFALAMRGHLMAGRQLASAARRAWWPILALGTVVSRRCRWIALLAVAADVGATPTDVAYGWGMWTGMRRHRTAAPIVPRLSPWPPRRRPRRADGPRVAPDGAVR